MDKMHPVYTEKTECQDCYKCLRHCPVKAIKVEDGHASIIAEFCTACGHCVLVCPAHAKKYRNDRGRAVQLLQAGKPVYVTLAPSWVGEFPNVSPSRMSAVLRRLGFAGVAETALGAQVVSAATAEILADAEPDIFISSACPAAVKFIQTYYPGYAGNILKLNSPVLTHAGLLRREFGNDIAVVMLSPCIAKKHEADLHPGLLNLSLTFSDLREMMIERKIEFTDVDDTGPGFIQPMAEEGALYPVEGGMAETLRKYDGLRNVRMITITGLQNIQQALENFNPADLDAPVFLEVLACQGGCVNGPCVTRRDAGFTGALKVYSAAKVPERIPARIPEGFTLAEEFPGRYAAPENITNEMIKLALARSGKLKQEDELNCGGCGYETCRTFAKAMIEGKAEPAMCVSYMRKMALKKANALLRCMPSAVVVADRELKIIECNERFAEMFNAVDAFEAKPGMAGALLKKILPFAGLFETVLETGRDIHRDSFKFGERLLNVTVFAIEPGMVNGAVIYDVTGTELRREQIAAKAQEVIKKNMFTVQEIACMLGEHMADTEILLRSIAEDYAGDGCKNINRKTVAGDTK